MKLKRLHWSLLSIVALTVAGFSIWMTSYQNDISNDTATLAETEQLPIVPLEEAYPYVIEPNTSLFEALRRLDVSPQVIQEVVTASKPIQNLARLQPGIRFQVYYGAEPEPELNGIHFRFSAVESMEVVKVDAVWSAKKITEQVDIKVVSFSGMVTTSLWESAIKAKMDPNLISELADILGWEVDFSREVRVNDRWRLTVEEKLVKGEPIGWGAILAAEYENAGTSYQAALFRREGKEVGYFAPDGTSLRKMFLKSPIRYGRITSGFSTRRFHPILKIRRPHLGVDYGAPIGTPIRAVGDGTVTFAARKGGAGNMIKLRHNSTYQTAYKHLNGFAKGVRSGAKVKQGQVIGYVGNTGLSTGPHLHFEFYQSGRYIDPVRKKFPSAEPVAREDLIDFKQQAQTLLSGLPAWDLLEANGNEIKRETANVN